MKEYIRKTASSIGLDACRITIPRISQTEKERIVSWLAAGYAAEMQYMYRNLNLRTHPETLSDSFYSVVCVALGYDGESSLSSKEYVLSRYAFGKDYHIILRDKLYQLFQQIKEKVPGLTGRVCVDSVPIPEHALAAQSGLGWVGKNSLLIVPGSGSYVFLGELFLSVALEPDQPATSRCGSCTRCMDACPTGAIVAPHTIDASKCLSYKTIEFRGRYTEKEPLHQRMFGCDICQEVCPWNRQPSHNVSPIFKPSPELMAMKGHDWETLTEARFNSLFDQSAVRRAGYDQLMRNIRQIGKTSCHRGNSPEQE